MVSAQRHKYIKKELINLLIQGQGNGYNVYK